MTICVINYVHRKFLDPTLSRDWTLGGMQVDMQAKLEALADLKRLDVSFRKLTTTFQVPRNWVMLERTLLLLMGLCTELDPSWNPMAVIRPYLEDVVLGKDRDWSRLFGGSLKGIALSAAAIPQEHPSSCRKHKSDHLATRLPQKHLPTTLSALAKTEADCLIRD